MGGESIDGQLAIAPGSWGAEPPGDPTNPPRDFVLGEIARAGYGCIELGPVGYLPESPGELEDLLRHWNLKLVAGFAMEPYHRLDQREALLAMVERTCRALSAGGASRVVLIEALTPERSATMGRSAKAERLDPPAWEAMVESLDRAIEIAAKHGLSATFHPHAGTAVEFRDELDKLLEALDPSRLGLCLDTGHAILAGIDPVELIEAYGDRIDHLHLKDVNDEVLAKAIAGEWSFEESVAAGVFTRLGKGCVDLPAISAALSGIGFAGFATVEQDRLPGDPAATSDAEDSRKFAEAVGFSPRPHPGRATLASKDLIG
jgi:inosose dehydratase